MTADCKIEMFLHCARCIEEAFKAGQSPGEYSRYDVGWTGIGLQVWCRRHNQNIALIDFEGQSHPVDARGDLTGAPVVSGYLGEDHAPECECCKEGTDG